MIHSHVVRTKLETLSLAFEPDLFAPSAVAARDESSARAEPRARSDALVRADAAGAAREIAK